MGAMIRMNIANDKVASRVRCYEPRSVRRREEKWINPPPYNWINRRFVARPASPVTFYWVSLPSARQRRPARRGGGAMMYVPRDLYPLQGCIK